MNKSSNFGAKNQILVNTIIDEEPHIIKGHLENDGIQTPSNNALITSI